MFLYVFLYITVFGGEHLVVVNAGNRRDMIPVFSRTQNIRS